MQHDRHHLDVPDISCQVERAVRPDDRKGSVLVADAAETQGKCSVLVTDAAETQGRGSVLRSVHRPELAEPLEACVHLLDIVA